MQADDFKKTVQAQKSTILAYLKNLWIAVDQIKDQKILLQAFVHKSFAADYKDAEGHNERLEFLGDGILGAIVNKLLFSHHPEMSEAELTLYKIALVREEILAEVARDIHLDKMLFISHGEERTEGRKKDSILSDGLESLIWFLYIDLGVPETEKFITTYIYSKLGKIQKNPVKSYKTLIQELIQKEYKTIPEYKDIEEEIDDKKNVTQYRSEIRLNDKKQSEWFGPNKKKAQEEAAKNYYLDISIKT